MPAPTHRPAEQRGGGRDRAAAPVAAAWPPAGPPRARARTVRQPPAGGAARPAHRRAPGSAPAPTRVVVQATGADGGALAVAWQQAG